MPEQITRRSLIQRASLAAGLAALGGVWTDANAVTRHSANDTLNVAHVGVGGQGGSDLGEISGSPGVNIVALCDVDDARAADSFKRFPNARKYKDFRKLLDNSKDIDAVVVSTPDHNHAPVACAAMSLGKHVYCQKPLAHSVAEARHMMETARKHKVVTQMGTQGHPSYARTVDYVRAGIIGPVHEVHVQTDRPIWPQGMMLPTGSAPVPATLDWEQWLGPAKDRPYHPEYLPFIWRGWWDFGTGALGDMACHLMDGAFWSLNLSYPTAVETEGELANRVSAPKWMIARYDFPQRGEMPPVRLTWYEGGKKIPQELLGATKLDAGFNGSLFVGDKGKMLVPHGGDPQVLDAALQSIPAPDRVTKPAPNGHYREWVDACRTGGPTGSNFDYAAPMTESILLGIVAFRTGTRVQYDAKNMQAVNSPDADDYIQYHSRKGWKLAS